MAYFGGFYANGGTLGMQSIGIRLEDKETGGDIGVQRAVLRYVVRIASGLAIYLGFLWYFWDDDKQTWHDRAANSVVVKQS